MSVAVVPVHRQDVVRSWLCLPGFVPSFFAAFAVGEGLSTAFGYDVGTSAKPPYWVMFASTVPALVVFAIPGVAAWILGRRAARHGDRRGNVPAVMGAVIAGAFVVMNVLAAFVSGM